MKAWKRLPLGDVSDSVDYGVTASASTRPVGPKFLRITDIQDGDVNWESVPWCECDSRTAKASQLAPGDIVFARTGATTGKSYLIRECPENAVFASYLIRLRLAKALEPRFISHFFRSPEYWAQITKSANGVAQPGVNASILKTIKVPVPPISDQHRIAEILDKTDALRAKRRAIIAELDTLTQSIFLDMFGDLARDSGKWPKAELGNFAEIISGITKGRDPRGKPTRAVPYLAVVNVQDRKLDLSVVKMIDATGEEIDRYRLVRNDLLLTEGGDPDKLGRGTLWHEELQECIHQNHIFRVRVTDNQVLRPLFLNWLIGSEYGKRYFLRSAKQTTGIASINMTQLRAFPLLLPEIRLQVEFETRVAEVESLKKRAIRASIIADELFTSLQASAFTGGLAPRGDGWTASHSGTRTAQGMCT